MLFGPLRRLVLVVAMGPGGRVGGRGAGAPAPTRGPGAFLCSLMGRLLPQNPVLAPKTTAPHGEGLIAVRGGHGTCPKSRRGGGACKCTQQ